MVPEAVSTARINGANRHLTAGQAARTPPQDLDAEKALLGAMLLSLPAASVGIEICSAADFYAPAHGHIFGAIHALMERGKGIDAVTVNDELKRSGLMEAVGDPSIFVSLQANTPGTAYARHYAAIVAEKSRLRQVIESGSQIVAAGYSGETDVAEAIAQRVLADIGARSDRPGRLVDGGHFVASESDVVPVWGDGENVLWASGEELLIVGLTGLGKTSLAQQLLLHRTGLRAGPLLGLPVVVDPDGVVLYLAMDRPRQAARSLRRMVGDGQLDELDRRLKVWRGPPERDLAKHPEELHAMARRSHANTVFVDSLKDAAVGLSDDEVGAGWNRAVQLCLAEGVEVLGLHHQRKAQQGGSKKPKTIDDVYGSVWIVNGAGSVVLLWGSPGDQVVELTHLKQPIAVVGPLKVKHDHRSGTSTVIEDFNLLSVLRTSPSGLSAPEAARLWFNTDHPDDAQLRKAKRALERLRHGGLAQRQEARQGGAGGTHAAQYFAVTDQEDESS